MAEVPAAKAALCEQRGESSACEILKIMSGRAWFEPPCTEDRSKIFIFVDVWGISRTRFVIISLGV